MKWIETMHCKDGRVMLLEYHLDRLCWGFYQNQIKNVCILRQHCLERILQEISDLKGVQRVRMLFDDEDLSFEFTHSSIQSQSLNHYSLGVYSEEYKRSVSPWNAKTFERDLYARAQAYAQRNFWDDAIILNEKGRVVETTIFNVFILKENVLYTPPLSDMPVKGVMRSWMMSNSVFPIIERSLSVEELYIADQIFLTNAVRGIQIGQLAK